MSRKAASKFAVIYVVAVIVLLVFVRDCIWLFVLYLTILNRVSACCLYIKFYGYLLFRRSVQRWAGKGKNGLSS